MRFSDTDFTGFIAFDQPSHDITRVSYHRRGSAGSTLTPDECLAALERSPAEAPPRHRHHPGALRHRPRRDAGRRTGCGGERRTGLAGRELPSPPLVPRGSSHRLRELLPARPHRLRLRRRTRPPHRRRGPRRRSPHHRRRSRRHRRRQRRLVPHHHRHPATAQLSPSPSSTASAPATRSSPATSPPPSTTSPREDRLARATTSGAFCVSALRRLGIPPHPRRPDPPHPHPRHRPPLTRTATTH